MLRKFSIITLAALLSACATPPANYAVSNSRIYQKPYDQIWEDLVAFFAKNNIQVKNIAKDSGVIYAEAARFDDSVADCGTPGLFMITGRRANFNVFVSRTSKDPVVSVNTEFNEVRRFDSNVITVQCNSKGILEQRVLAAISPN